MFRETRVYPQVEPVGQYVPSSFLPRSTPGRGPHRTLSTTVSPAVRAGT